MTPDAVATATATAVSALAASFMTDVATYVRGAELGFEGVDFYVAGRGGALGDVDGEVVAATFTFFTTEAVVTAWDAGRRVMAPQDAAAHFITAGHTWAEDHLDAEVDLARLADLLATMVAGAPVAGAPLFAAWRRMPEPPADHLEAVVLHRMNLLRELRGALHGAAVLAHGVTPHEAVTIRQPQMLGLFGYDGPADLDEDDHSVRAHWAEAEAATDRALAPAYATLDPGERAELCDLLEAVMGSLSG